jgi:hypothetical protein
MLSAWAFAAARAQDPYQIGQPSYGGPSYGTPSIGGPPLVRQQYASPDGRSPAAFPQNPATNQPAEPPQRETEPVVTGEVFEPGEVLAIVGDQYILAADVLPHVNQVIEQYKGKVPDEVMQKQRRAIIAQLTGSHVEVKLLYLSFLRKVPADKIQGIHKKVGESFDKDLESLRKKVEEANREELPDLMKGDPQLARLALLMKEAGVWSPGELDSLLRKYGGSLNQEKQYYAEYKLGRAMVSQGLDFHPEITHDEILDYYQEHATDYAFPTRVRFEIMSVRFSYFPDKQQALEAICAMGNRVLNGANFAAVAKQSSQGLNAEKGGYHDWTPRGSLASKVLDEALFTLPLNALSTIIEDERGYHIVRVLDRQEAGKVPFVDVQQKIRENIKQEKLTKQYKELAVKLKDGVSVWTAFDDDPLLSRAIRHDDRKQR